MKNKITPQRLPIDFKDNSSQYTLLRRSEKSAVYKQYIDGVLVGYELYSPINTRPEEKIKDKTYKYRETTPSTSLWSQNAWTLGIYYTEEQVLEKFEQKVKENG